MATKKKKCDRVKQIRQGIERTIRAWLKRANELGYSIEKRGDEFLLAIGIAKPDKRINSLNAAHEVEIESFFKSLMDKFYLINETIEKTFDRMVLHFKIPVFTA